MSNVWKKFADPAWQGAAITREVTDDGLSMGNTWGTPNKKYISPIMKRVQEQTRLKKKQELQGALQPKKFEPLKKHATHPAEVREGNGPHPAQYWCTQCDCHIAWMNKDDYDTYKEIKNGKV
jgi:hypothetical protein